MAFESRPVTSLTKRKPQTGDAAFQQARTLFYQAAKRVPAYKDFLQKAKIDPEKIISKSDFLQIPPIDKPNYISAYSLAELSWDGTLIETKYISSSSGSTGVPFYWPRGTTQNIDAGTIFQNIFENIFQTNTKTTLFVNLFALGTWIAGFEFYNAALFASEHGSRMAIATPGIEKTTALAAIKRLAHSFDTIVLVGYPPFIKDVLEFGLSEGVIWSDLDIRIITGGESFSELWREKILTLIGRPGVHDRISNVYGMAEVGIVGHETPLTTLIRQKVTREPLLHTDLLFEGNAAALYQYDPLKRYLETGENNNLLLTANAGLPLVRYNTRDQGGLLETTDIQTLYSEETLQYTQWLNPMVQLQGRRDLSLSFYALNVYIENIKHSFESFAYEHKLSGLFSMKVGSTKNLDQKLEITVELARGEEPDTKTRTDLTQHVVHTLKKVNSEYAKLHKTLGTRAKPHITFTRHGHIDSTPGRKHRWVKPS